MRIQQGATHISWSHDKNDKNGISADPEKTSAILEMEKPQSLPELRWFLGMVNQLSKFSPNVVEVSKPLRELMSTKKFWLWGPAQEKAFHKVKLELARPTVLALYDPQVDTKICADASAYRLGAVPLQQHSNSDWKPVAYASKALSDTERRHSQTEKEALALAWACEKFANYVLVKTIHLETNHKPLVPLLSRTNLDSLPPQVLKFRLHLTRFCYTISHVPGKFLYMADALSRAPVASTDGLQIQEEVQSSSQVRLFPICQPAKGWPDRRKIKGDLSPYWQV